MRKRKIVLFLIGIFYAMSNMVLGAKINQQDSVWIYLQLSIDEIPHSLQQAKYYLSKARFCAVEQNSYPAAELLLQEGRIYLKERDNLKADSLFRLALQPAKQEKELALQAKIYSAIAEVDWNRDRVVQSIANYHQAYKLAQEIKDSILMADILIEQSYNFSRSGKEDTALILLQKANELAEKIAYQKAIGKLSTAVGNIYVKLHKYRDAIGYYRKAFHIAKALNSNAGMGVSLENIGICYASTSQYKKAIDTLELSIPYLKKSNELDILNAVSRDLANIYADMGNFSLAYQKLNQVISYYRKVEDLYHLGISYHVYSTVCFMEGHVHRSNLYLDSCLQIAQKIDFPELERRTYSAYVRNYKKIKNTDKALRYFEKSVAIKDSLQEQQMRQQLMDFEAKYKTLEKEKEIQLLERNRAIDKVNLKRRQWERNALILAFVVFLIIAFLVYQKWKKDRQLDEIRKEKDQLKKKELEKQIDFQSKQLTTHALNMMQKNSLLHSLQNDLKGITSNAKQELKPELRKLRKNIEFNLKNEKDWEVFKLYFEQLNKDFFKRLIAQYPDLTSGDLRLTALLKLNLNTKEIAAILNLSPDSVKNARYRLRKKFKLSQEEELFEFISRI